MPYLWQRPGWPELQFRAGDLVDDLVRLAEARAALRTRAASIEPSERTVLASEALSVDAIATAKIEGEALPPASVRSSVARRLGLETGAPALVSRDVEGLVEMLDDATRRHDEPLTSERLFGWHAALFPSGYARLHPIAAGRWRREEVEVRSGAIGRERIHFEAPPACALNAEMRAFLDWWNSEQPQDYAIKAGVAHLWFETIHPFDDGNGRIGRALIDMALAAGDQERRRFYSVSAQISAERSDYYRSLESAQRGDVDVTEWLRWFLGCALRAIQSAESTMETAQLRAGLRGRLLPLELNPRQIKVITKLIEREPAGFEGGLTNVKYRSMTGASKATATRDLADLVARGVLSGGTEGGRSTRYRLSLEV